MDVHFHILAQLLAQQNTKLAGALGVPKLLARSKAIGEIKGATREALDLPTPEWRRTGLAGLTEDAIRKAVALFPDDTPEVAVQKAEALHETPTDLTHPS